MFFLAIFKVCEEQFSCIFLNPKQYNKPILFAASIFTLLLFSPSITAESRMATMSKKTKPKVMKSKEKEKKKTTIHDNGTNKGDNNNNNNVFASCSFSSLGLHQTLCDQLHGNSFFLSSIFVF